MCAVINTDTEPHSRYAADGLMFDVFLSFNNRQYYELDVGRSNNRSNRNHLRAQMALVSVRLGAQQPHNKQQPPSDDGRLPEIALLEVAEHDSASDCWLVIYDRVYDVTGFLDAVGVHTSNRNSFF